MPLFRLKISRVEHTCLFELTWDGGRQITAQLPYANGLGPLYQSWHQTYRAHYQSLDNDDLRGRKIASGQLTPTQDWQAQLVQTEAALLAAFHKWLRREPLFEIRQALGQAGEAAPVNLLIACTDTDLARLPWESWEISAEFGSRRPIRIARLPVNIRATAARPRPQRGKARVLVILGDDTGLDFRAELDAIATLHRVVEIHPISYKPGIDTDALRQEICETIADPAGWDMLLFFGHSNEANTVGGTIAIAPNATLSLRELTPYLQKAQLRFALFNSCEGLDIAQSLVNLGISQVVVMREPIHNRVAQVFLIQFLQSLAQFEDVHTALQTACEFLASKSNLTYPSAHLVPSLFRHADADLFQLQPIGWRAWLRACLPQSRWQAATLGAIATLSLVSPITEPLLQGRLWTQSVYRGVTQQMPTQPPPVLLVQIDDESVAQGIDSGNPYPMDRAYLSRLVDRMVALEAQVIGIDYLLDRQQADNDAQFAESLAAAVEAGTWVVFGTILDDVGEVQVIETVADLDWTMQGYTNTPHWYVRALPFLRDCQSTCPFGYLLALTQTTGATPLAAAVRPDLSRDDDLRSHLIRTIQTQDQHPDLRQLTDLRLSPWATLSRHWRQRWLHPVLDFSMPPDRVMNQLSAYELLTLSEAELQQYDWQNQVVILASGAYNEAGTDHYTPDYYPRPAALSHWNRSSATASRWITGGEAIAYTVHHLLTRHWLVPIPDLWLVGMGAIAGAGLPLLANRWGLSQRQRRWGLGGLSAGYGLVSLQLAASAVVILPWLLPTATVWVYCLPHLRQAKPRSR